MEKAGTMQVVLIDQNELQREALKEILETFNSSLNIITFSSGEEAITYLKSSQPQFSEIKIHPVGIIFTSVQLLDLDGFGVIRRLKAEPSLGDIPIVLYSPSFEKSQIKKAYNVGANFCMEKLRDKDEMLKHISAIFDFLSKAGNQYF